MRREDSGSAGSSRTRERWFPSPTRPGDRRSLGWRHHPGGEQETGMTIMVTFTLKTDPATYQSLHGQMIDLAMPAGMLFHSSLEVGGQVGIVDFWPSDESWKSFS